MPAINDMEVARRMKETAKTTVGIFLTACSDLDTIPCGSGDRVFCVSAQVACAQRSAASY